MGGADNVTSSRPNARAVLHVIVVSHGSGSHGGHRRSFHCPGSDSFAGSSSLIGEWSGSWTTAGAVQHTNSGRYYLTIETVEGDKVHGKGRFEGKRATDFSFVGTLAGDRLKYGTNSVADLQVSGNRMRGKIQGRVNWDVELVKAK